MRLRKGMRWVINLVVYIQLCSTSFCIIGQTVSTTKDERLVDFAHRFYISRIYGIFYAFEAKALIQPNCPNHFESRCQKRALSSVRQVREPGVLNSSAARFLSAAGQTIRFVWKTTPESRSTTR